MDKLDPLETLLEMLPDRTSKTNVLTPVRIAKEMVDLLPQDVWNSHTKFLDSACKSGIFLYEIQKKLMKTPSLIKEFPDAKVRRQHILKNQLYGIAMDGFSQLITIRTVYGHLTDDNNIICIAGYLNKIKTQTYTEFKNTLDKEFKQEMKFDVVIGNPPYNKGMDLDFVNKGYELSQKYTCMITPAKWQTAEANQNVASKISYGQFREQIVTHMSRVCFFPDSFDVFDIQLKEGITYYILDKKLHSQCLVENRSLLQPKINSIVLRDITNGESLWNCGDEILKSLGNHKKFAFGDMSKRYVVYTNKNMSHGGGHLSSGGGNTQGSGSGGYFFTVNGNLNCVSKSSIEDTSRKVVLTQSHVTKSFSADTREECESFVSWINTKFTRFFVMVGLCRRDVQFDNHGFRFVPAPPSGKFDHIYTDEELYKAFNLPQKYIDVIESVIKERK